jgi:hypothetical protein
LICKPPKPQLQNDEMKDDAKAGISHLLLLLLLL